MAADAAVHQGLTDLVQIFKANLLKELRVFLLKGTQGLYQLFIADLALIGIVVIVSVRGLLLYSITMLIFHVHVLVVVVHILLLGVKHGFATFSNGTSPDLIDAYTVRYENMSA